MRQDDTLQVGLGELNEFVCSDGNVVGRPVVDSGVRVYLLQVKEERCSGSVLKALDFPSNGAQVLQRTRRERVSVSTMKSLNPEAHGLALSLSLRIVSFSQSSLLISTYHRSLHNGIIIFDHGSIDGKAEDQRVRVVINQVEHLRHVSHSIVKRE